MPNQIHPKVIVFVFLSHATKEVVGFLPILPEILMQELRERATNLAYQGVAFATMDTLEKNLFLGANPSKIAIIPATFNKLTQSNSPEDLILGAALTILSAAATNDAQASSAYGAFLFVFAKKMFESQAFIPSSLLNIVLLRKAISFVVTEIGVEVKRRKLKLKRRPIQLFKLSKEKKTLECSYLRIKLRKVKILKKQFHIPIIYEKIIPIKSPAMVEHILVK